MTGAASVHLVSDFTLDLLGRYLEQSEEAPHCTASGHGYGQAYQALLTPQSATIDFGIVWTRAEGVLPGFARILEGHEVDHETVLAEVEGFTGAVRTFARQARFVFCATWSLLPTQRGYGPLDWRPGIGLAGLVAQMNLRLAAALADVPNVFVLDSARWIQAAGPAAAAPRMWYAGKVPYANAVFKAGAADIKAAMRAALGQSRKLVVLDLDNTLWGGVVGEVGWQALRLGGHDHVGEAFLGFQQALKALSRRGIQLAIASKNDEAVALEVFRSHPEMVLRLEDFAAWRIDWNDKARNVSEIAEELNLGLGSVVFIDDTPAERARVRDALPEVVVPEWPADPVLYASKLDALPWFDPVTLSTEDRHRGRMYAEERARRTDLSLAGSVDDWLHSLEQRATFRPLRESDLARAAQLLNKTNQLNLSTRRLSEAELAAWAARSDTRLWTIRVEDRFGDSGLAGIVSVEVTGRQARIIDFVLSCRVMGRRVEEAMIFAAARFAREVGATRLLARHLPTERNGPTLMTLRKSHLAERGEGAFEWDCGSAYPAPQGLALLGLGEVAPHAAE